MLQVPSPLVSAKWLRENRSAQNLVTLDGSIPKVTGGLGEVNMLQIPRTRFFDIKRKFSNVDDPFPNAVPSEEQFTKNAQALGINKDSAIVVYDEQGIYSSARVWYLFKAFGHDNVAVLDGGLPEWVDKGFPTETKISRQVEVGDFEAKYSSSYFNFFENIKDISSDDSCLIMDARSSDRFNSEVPEPRKDLRGGNIPNSVSLPYSSLMNGYRLKQEGELKKAFNKLVSNQKKLVFSCGSGITACVLALAAELIGEKECSVYDGSWTEYGSLTTRE